MATEQDLLKLKEAAELVNDVTSARALRHLAKYLPDISQLAADTAVHLEKLTSSRVVEAQSVDQLASALNAIAVRFDQLVKMLENEKAKDDALRGLERETLTKLNRYLDDWGR